MVDIYTPDSGKCFYAAIERGDTAVCPYRVTRVFEGVTGYTWEANGVVILSVYDTSLVNVKKWDYQNSTWQNPTFIDVEFRYVAAHSTDDINVGAGDVCLTDAIKRVSGSYVGNGEATRKIDLDFTPSAVYVSRNDGVINDGITIYGGLAVADSPVISADDIKAVEIVENGFNIARNTGVNTNMSTTTYNYVAVK